METHTTKLSLEQEFSLRAFADQVQYMSPKQTQDFLIQLYKHMMLKENMYKGLIKHEWGIA